MKVKNHIVIARYNEDLSWIKEFYREDTIIFVYNKGGEIRGDFFKNIEVINLKNIGRESQTYLHHILVNYNSLPEKIIFTQAHPDDHVSNAFKSEIFNFLDSNSDFQYFSKNILDLKILEDGVEESGNLNGSFWRNKHSLDSCCVTVPFGLIEDIRTKKWVFGTGAIFGVSKNSIIKNSEEFYLRSMNILENSSDQTNPPEGHALERSWYLIFN